MQEGAQVPRRGWRWPILVSHQGDREPSSGSYKDLSKRGDSPERKPGEEDDQESKTDCESNTAEENQSVGRSIHDA